MDSYEISLIIISAAFFFLIIYLTFCFNFQFSLGINTNWLWVGKYYGFNSNTEAHPLKYSISARTICASFLEVDPL